MADCSIHGSCRVRAMSDEQSDQRQPDAAFARHTPRTNQTESRVQRRLISARARVQDHGCNVDHAWIDPSVPDRILRNELEQRGIPKIVAAFERYALAHDAWMLPEVASQSFDVYVI